MSQYTTELRYLITQGYDFGLNEYPIFDETYRAVLNKKILDHYYYKEIGFETPARFKHYLKATMNEIMPYYNKLYQSELLSINPLHNVNYTETYTKTNVGTTLSDSEATQTTSGTGTSESEAGTTHTSEVDALQVQDSTPAGLLSVADLKSNTWASSASREDSINTENSNTTGTNTTTDTSTGTSTGTQEVKANTTEDYIKTVAGNLGGASDSDLILKYRQSLLNIDLLVIGELNNLFMGVY